MNSTASRAKNETSTANSTLQRSLLATVTWSTTKHNNLGLMYNALCALFLPLHLQVTASQTLDWVLNHSAPNVISDTIIAMHYFSAKLLTNIQFLSFSSVSVYHCNQLKLISFNVCDDFQLLLLLTGTSFESASSSATNFFEHSDFKSP